MLLKLLYYLASIWLIVLCVVLVRTIIIAFSAWCVYAKMDIPGWKVIIPYYGSYMLFQRLWSTDMYMLWVAVTVLAPICLRDKSNLVIIAGVVLLVISRLINVGLKVKLAEAFGHSALFGAGLALAPVVFYPILAFDGSGYYNS